MLVSVTTFASFVPQLTPRNFLPFGTKQFNAYYKRFRAKVINRVIPVLCIHSGGPSGLDSALQIIDRYFCVQFFSLALMLCSVTAFDLVVVRYINTTVQMTELTKFLFSFYRH